MKPIVTALLAAVLAAGACALFCGCEAESAQEAEIIVTPSAATLSVGQSVTLTASGWESYRWSLSDEQIGVLSQRTGETVVYTSVAAGGTNAVQIVTVTGLGVGGATSSNAVTPQVTGQAAIRHR